MTLGVNEKIYFYVNKAFKKYKSDKMKIKHNTAKNALDLLWK